MLWLIPALVAVHNVEEALTFGRYLPVVRERLPVVLRPLVPTMTYREMLLALAVATLVPLAIIFWAWRRPSSIGALWSALLVQTVMLLNVGSHVVAALFLVRGYAPGLATALALNLPFSLYLLCRAERERWLSRDALIALIPAAVLVHGALLVELLLLARAVGEGS